MQMSDTIPEHFPGKEFCLSDPMERYPEYIYELNWLKFAKTTQGSPVVIPYIEYRAFVELDTSIWTMPYADASASKIAFNLLTESQQQAIVRAQVVEQQIKDADPIHNEFVGLRRLDVDNNGLIYVSESEEGSSLHNERPFAAAKSVEALGTIDFATSVRGYYGWFKYDEADIDASVPNNLADRANAYTRIDQPRLVTGLDSESDYHIARVMLLDVEIDNVFPRNRIAAVQNSSS